MTIDYIASFIDTVLAACDTAIVTAGNNPFIADYSGTDHQPLTGAAQRQ